MNPLTAARLSVMMFLQFFLWGSWYVTAYLFLGKIGFGGGEIGWTYSVGPIAGILSPFFVGMIADRFFSTERVLAVMHLLGGGFMLLAITMMGSAAPDLLILGETSIQLPVLGLTEKAASALVINLLFFGHMLCYFPTLALTNSLAMHNMKDPQKYFPFIRVFGTIGWIVSNIFVSWQGWDRSVNMFYLAAFSAILMGLYSFTLPHTPPPSKGKKISFSQVMGFDALVLFRKPAFLVFMLCSFLVCIPLAFYYQLAPKFIAQGGLAHPAFKMSFGQMSEIIFMLLMPLFFARLGVKWMLFVGMLAWVARYALFAIGAPDSVMWMLLSGIVLHGICYDFFFVTGQIYTDNVAPKEIRSQAQGMLVLFTLGLGMLIGAQVAGKVEVAYTPPETGRLLAEAGFIEFEQDKLQKDLDAKLKEIDEEMTKKFEKAKKEIVEADEPPSDVKAMLKNVLARASHPVNKNFNESVDAATEELQARIDELDKKIAELQGKDPGNIDAQIQLHEQQKAKLENLKEKIGRLRQLAADYAEERIAALKTAPPSKVQPLLETQEEIRRLNGYKELKQSQANQAVNWKMIWLLPAVFAAVIMIFFALVFKDTTKEDDVKVADKTPAEELAKPGTDDKGE